jgi:hypothetical protein
VFVTLHRLPREIAGPGRSMTMRFAAGTHVGTVAC